MMYRGPFKYKIELSGGANKRKIIKKTIEGKTVNFSSPVTDKNLPKLYVLSIEKEIVYMGYTSQSVSSRLYYGLRANGKNGYHGYHGYKWKQQQELSLDVFVFQDFFGKDAKENIMYYQFIEAIEAELVYLVRHKTGKWPKFQNEIHFHNEKLKTAKEKALEMYNLLIR